MSKLRAAHDIISQQAATIAKQQTAIQSAHDTKTTTAAALLRAVDETEDAHRTPESSQDQKWPQPKSDRNWTGFTRKMAYYETKIQHEIIIS